MTVRNRGGLLARLVETVRGGPGAAGLRRRLTLDVHGAEELPESFRPTLLVGNYASAADPGLVLAALPVTWRRRTAVVLPRAGSRGRRGARRTVPLPDQPSRRVGKLLTGGRHVVAFPEGEPSPDGFVRPFRSELFDVVLSRRAPVLPVGIRGSYAAVPGGDRRPVPGRPRVSVRLGAPLHPAPGETAPAFARRVQQEVQRLIEEDATTWWATQRHAVEPDRLPPAASWRRIWEQTKVPTAGGRPRRSKIWRS